MYGLPQSMGSKKAFTNPKTKRAYVVDDKPKELRSFQNDMRAAMAETAPETPCTGPVSVNVTFWLPRPKGHFGTGKNAGVKKASAPSAPTSKPDVDKVARAVLDCGTGLWFKDDSQVVTLQVFKRYAFDDRPKTVVGCECWDAAQEADRRAG